MKTIIVNKKKNLNTRLEFNFEILSNFEMKKIVGGDGDDDDNDDPDPIKWAT